MKANGKDDIPYMKWKIKVMFETTNQYTVYIYTYCICIFYTYIFPLIEASHLGISRPGTGITVVSPRYAWGMAFLAEPSYLLEFCGKKDVTLKNIGKVIDFTIFG